MKEGDKVKMTIEEFMSFLGRGPCKECEDEITLESAIETIEDDDVITQIENGGYDNCYAPEIVKVLNYAIAMYNTQHEHS